MKIPKARVDLVRRAYRMSVAEEKELARLYAFESMIEATGEDHEFGEAIISVLDPKVASSIYVLGGRKLALTSPILLKKAAKFLEADANTLSFFYPKIDSRPQPVASLWHHNTARERFELKDSIQAMSSKPIARKVRCIEIDASKAESSPIAWQLLSLCGPFTSTTVASSAPLGHAAGYIYIEGPRDRWVLLKPDQATRAATIVESALKIANVEHGPIREQVDRLAR